MAFEPLGETYFQERRTLKVQLGRQLIDGRADPLEVFRHSYIVDILRKTIRRPLLLTIQRYKAELACRMAVVFSVLLIYNSIRRSVPTGGHARWKRQGAHG
jgi:hypothetical protein